MNQTLKEALTTLTLETGADWVSLLPMPYIGLRTPLYFRCPHLLFEILSGGPSPMLPNLLSDILAEYDQRKFLKSLEALHRVQKQLWPAMCQVYESAPPHNPLALNQVTKSGLRDLTTRLWILTGKDPTL